MSKRRWGAQNIQNFSSKMYPPDEIREVLFYTNRRIKERFETSAIHEIATNITRQDWPVESGIYNPLATDIYHE
jgi:hypothetical protein